MDSIERTALEVAHDEPGRRYELRNSGEPVGLIDYHRRDGVVDMVHTEIRPVARGRGLGAVLVRGALDDVRSRNERVVPSCWYVREFIEAHPEYHDLLAD